MAGSGTAGFHLWSRESFEGSFYCRNLMKPWAFIRVPYMNPAILGL